MRRTGRGDGWISSFREHSTVLSPDRQSVFSFDLEGRPLSWFEGERVYKRSLASEVHARERVAGSRRYWKLSPSEASEAFALILDRAARAPVGDAGVRGHERLAGILRWTPESLQRERDRFEAAYRPVNILPPDQYLAIVVQGTFGCSWNRCSFCSFYADQTFRARSPEEFEVHCEKVKELLGRGAALRRRIFLGGGNALMLSDRRLLPLLRSARGVFPERPISGFVDVPGGERKDVADWNALRAEGLERVHVGLETGNDDLLRWLNKPGSRRKSRELVTALKRARLTVAVILMVGVGGKRFEADHLRETISLLESLPLERGDAIYLSPFIEHEGSSYAINAREEGVVSLEGEELGRQFAELREGARRTIPSVTVARYDIREFVY